MSFFSHHHHLMGPRQLYIEGTTCILILVTGERTSSGSGHNTATKHPSELIYISILSCTLQGLLLRSTTFCMHALWGSSEACCMYASVCRLHAPQDRSIGRGRAAGRLAYPLFRTADKKFLLQINHGFGRQGYYRSGHLAHDIS